MLHKKKYPKSLRLNFSVRNGKEIIENIAVTTFGMKNKTALSLTLSFIN